MMRKFLYLLMRLHGLREGARMHFRCPVCALYRRNDARENGWDTVGHWYLPAETRISQEQK